MSERHLFTWRTFVSLSVLLSGCQSEVPLPPGMPTLHPVKLTVLQEGKPLPYASIRLIPEDSKSSWNSGGSTDEAGVAVIRTHGKFEGVPAGNYKVTVSKIETAPPATTDDGPLDRPSTNNDSAYDLVAPLYAYPNQTPLSVEVIAGDNRQDLDLGPAVRIKRKGPPS